MQSDWVPRFDATLIPLWTVVDLAAQLASLSDQLVARHDQHLAGVLGQLAARASELEMSVLSAELLLAELEERGRARRAARAPGLEEIRDELEGER